MRCTATGMDETRAFAEVNNKLQHLQSACRNIITFRRSSQAGQCQSGSPHVCKNLNFSKQQQYLQCATVGLAVHREVEKLKNVHLARCRSQYIGGGRTSRPKPLALHRSIKFTSHPALLISDILSLFLGLRVRLNGPAIALSRLLFVRAPSRHLGL